MSATRAATVAVVAQNFGMSIAIIAIGGL